MNFDSAAFLIFITGILAAFSLGGRQWRQTVFLCASIYFFMTYLPNWQSGLAILSTWLAGYTMTLYARRTGRLNIVVLLYLIISVCAFLIIRKYQIAGAVLGADWINHNIMFIGYSYILFRQLHVVIDAAQMTIPEIDLISYTAYIFSFLTLLAGPIQRYQSFRAQWDALGEWRMFELEPTLRALVRISSGLLGVYTLSLLIERIPLMAADLSGLPATDPRIAIINFYSYAIYFFFNFAGYCSIVIGLGMLLGFTLPENFNKPYVAHDPIDFWGRWHITMSEWLRDYIFTPYYKTGISRFGRQTLFFAVTGYLIAFFIAGMWHGTTLGYLLLGLMYGGSNAITKLLEALCLRLWGRRSVKRFRANPLVMLLSTLITLHFIALSLQLVQVDRSQDIVNWFAQIMPH